MGALMRKEFIQFRASSIDTGEAIYAWWRTIHFAIGDRNHLSSTGF
jgi:hypothetical protein